MFDLGSFKIQEYDAYLSRGLSVGIGKRDGQMCIEAAICATLGLEHGDDPLCVEQNVRTFKIALNDKKWSSPYSRAQALRDLGIAQLGSLGVVDGRLFVSKLSEKLIKKLVPKLFRQVFTSEICLDAAMRCEIEGSFGAATAAAASAAYDADSAAYAAASCAAYAASCAASYAASCAASYAASCAFYAAEAAAYDEYLKLCAALALEVLMELGSPGVKLLNLGSFNAL